MKWKPTHFLISIITLMLSLFAILGNISAQVANQQTNDSKLETSRLATIKIRPTNIRRGTSAELLITASGGLDLSHTGSEQVTILPIDNISRLQAVPQPDRNELLINFNIEANATVGPRTLIIVDGNHSVVASAAFSVRETLNCPGHEECCETDSDTGLCSQCRPHCPTPPNTCPPGKRCCDPGPGCTCTPIAMSCQ